MSVKKSILLSLTVLMILMILPGCRAATYTYPLVEAKNDNNVLLLNRAQASLFTYDTTTFAVTDTMEPASGYIISADNPMYTYYTIGHTSQNLFSIISLDGKKASVEYSLNPNETLVPFVFSDTYLFFVKGAANSDTKSIVRYDPATRELISYNNLTGLIYNGAIIGDTLYYTAFNTDTHAYTLFKTACQDPAAEPQVEQDVVSHEAIYAQGDNLYLTDKKFLYCGMEKRFRLEAQNYFIGSKHLLQYVEATNNAFDAVIIDTDTGARVKTAENLLGVSITDTEIILYCQGSVERFTYQ